MAAGSVREKAVLEALSEVQEPELGKDLVTLNMIKDLQIDGEQVSFTINLTTPACPLRDQIRRDAEQAVLALSGVSRVDVHLDATVPSDGRERGLIERPIRNAIAVGSGKGGVGKTTVAVNIAAALAQSGAAVGLLDADVYGPNVPTMLGLSKLPPAKSGKLVPADAYGVRVMSIAFLVPPDQPLIWRGPMLHSAIRQFIADVEWGELDYLIIDLPPGTGDAALSLSQSLPLSGAVIVTTPQKVSTDDARRGLEMFRTMEVPIYGVIENMSFLELPDGTKLDVFGQGGGQTLADERDVPFLGSIPIDPLVREAGDQGAPVVVSHPESIAAKALVAVAEETAAKVSVQTLTGGGISVEMVD